MSVKFSKDLVIRYKEYMKRQHDVVISYEEAECHLASLSRLYVSFSNSKKPKQTG
jgi:hypothetical protein